MSEQQQAQRSSAPRGSWYPKKRRADSTACKELQGTEMQEFTRATTELKLTASVAHGNEFAHRQMLARLCWGDAAFGAEEDSLCAANPELLAQLEVLTRNKYSPGVVAAAPHNALVALRHSGRLEVILACLARMKSQKNMPLVSVRVSLSMYRAQLPQHMWQLINTIAPGLLSSQDWIEQFLEFSREFRPEPTDDPLPLVGAAMFDNYMRRVLYQSTATTTSHGFQLKMTNSCSMLVPKKLASPTFDAASLCAPLHELSPRAQLRSGFLALSNL